MPRILPVIATLPLTILLAAPATAQNAPSQADLAVVYRKAIYQVMYNNFAPVAAMAIGRAPYDAKVAAQKAARANFLAQMASDGFPAVSADGKPTRAKPELWANRADFDTLLARWQKTMANLEVAAKSGKADKLKPAFEAARDACKACHDKYRLD